MCNLGRALSCPYHHTFSIWNLKIIENEINEMSGDSVLLETVALDKTQEDKVVVRFKADRDEEDVELIDKCADFEAEIAKETSAQHFTYAELEENDVDLKMLQTRLEAGKDP
ncbi:Chromate resistance protein ChrB [Paraburkholderia oxyphila]|uniref:Chromate resistance protein ChrB n=1 Tax=Paraburkholderia oxyphila TaxID=614212 RepID=UPI002ADE3E39|nr:Chromate resistance protein ChrB [Paraburkholderia oxyphila]